jgi:hypothetical protein
MHVLHLFKSLFKSFPWSPLDSGTSCLSHSQHSFFRAKFLLVTTMQRFPKCSHCTVVFHCAEVSVVDCHCAEVFPLHHSFALRQIFCCCFYCTEVFCCTEFSVPDFFSGQSFLLHSFLLHCTEITILIRCRERLLQSIVACLKLTYTNIMETP